MLIEKMLSAILNRVVNAISVAVAPAFAANSSRKAVSPGKLEQVGSPAVCAISAVQDENYGGAQSGVRITAGSRPGFSLLLFVLLMSAASFARAGLFCSLSPFNGVVDGTVDYTLIEPGFVFPTQITIDTDCTFQNFTASNPLTATLNFQTNDPSVYLITFNNVIFTGNMACANIDHRIWFVNGSDYGSKKNCQDLFIPVEAIQKQNPAGQTTVGIGDPYTYTLTIPVLYDPVTQTYINSAGSANDLHSIIITDDLNATGANLTLVGTPTVVWDDGSATPVAHTFNNASGLLTFVINPAVIIPAGDQILINITVVADNSNAIGTQIINTAKWSFGRLIEIDGVPTFFDPLPGENGVTQPLTIAVPNLVMNKVSPDTALNAGSTATFFMDVQNTGGSDAWGATILDLLPDVGPPGTDIGMCDFDPTPTVTAEIFAADGTTSISIGALAPGVDYSVSYLAAPACELSLTMLTARAVIGPTERLIISYQSQLDIAGTDPSDNGTVLTNKAGATQWFSADPAGSSPFITFNEVLTDGTPGVIDHEDSHDITAALSGYIYQKTVVNVSSGEAPATTAAPGDRLRYRLRLFNFTEVIDDVSFSDTLDPLLFDTGTFTMLTPLPANNVAFTFDSGTGLLRILGDVPPLNLTPPQELIIDFEINLKGSGPGLANGDVVPNQARIVSTVAPAIDDFSDNPFVNGVYDPADLADTPDTTDVLIQTPGALSKVNPALTQHTIGELFTYSITVPAAQVNTPLYDVRILDDLAASGADMVFVSAVDTGGTWVLSNTGTATSPVIEDLATGIDIPANGQAVIDVTVLLQNTLTNQSGVTFDNSATYTYNRTNGDTGTLTPGSADSSGNMTVVEPAITTITKVASNIAPTAGEVVTYTVTMTASGAANFSDVFDVTLVDSLDLGLAYVGNPTVSIGAGVGADNIIGEPDITGDGITVAQTLIWSVGSTDASDIDIEAGAVVTVEYDVRVLDSVLANQTIDNSVIALWTSRDGNPAIERTGVDGIGGLNDYVTLPVVETLTIADIVATIDKVRSSDTFNPADDNVRIGDTADYTLTVTMPEGTLGNLQLIDTLPQGLDFDSIVSINGITTSPYTAVAPFSHADITLANVVEAGDPALGPSTVTWSLGNVTNLPVDNASNDFVIVYRARILNDVLDPANLNIPLNNTVVMSYDTAAGTTTNSDAYTITALQPQLAVSKSVVTAGIDTVVVAGELITYTVDIANTGTSPAYDVVLQDIIPAGLRIGAVTIVSSDLVSVAGYAPLVPVYDAGTGVTTWNFDSGVADAYTIPVGDTLRVVYTVLADAAIGPGLTMINAATATLYHSFDNQAPPANSVVADRQIYGPSNTASTTLTTSPGVPEKLNPADPTATIGQEFTYTITIPVAAQPTPLFDVRVLDDLTAIAADVTLVSIDNLSGGAWVPANTSGTNNLVIEDLGGGIDIPANTQIRIGITLRLDNTAANNAAETFVNTASYTYNAIDGNAGSQLPGGSDTTSIMTKTEPALTTIKTVTNATPGKLPADPITGGDILQYVVTVSNGGGSTAFDVNVADTLPTELLYYSSFTPTAEINTAAVTGFVATPAGAPAGPLIWGNGNGDGSLDIPAGAALVLTYQAQVQVSTAATFNNEVWVDWSSLDGSNAFERDGAGCPVTSGDDDYCFGPVTVISSIIDNNALSKAITNDSWITDGSTAVDKTLRIGDNATYQLTLSLGEGTLNSVTVSDVLPPGVAINSFTITPTSGTGDFIYLLASQPSPDDTGTITWDFGTVVNTPSNDNSPVDTLVIEYVATVLPKAGIAQAATSNLINTATLDYAGSVGNANPAQLVGTDTLTLLQPLMNAVIKTGNLGENTNISPENVNVAIDTEAFHLESCNIAAPAAPAYSVLITDTLATQLDENSITPPVVTINGALGEVDVDYIYTAPTISGGTLQFALLTAVNPGQCVTVDYGIGFHTDFGPNQLWNNSVTVDEYWSLPVSSGQQYLPIGTAEYYMTNQVNIEPLSKDVTNPVSGEITVGEDAVYSVTVPAVPVNAVLNNVVVSDTLDAVLEYVNATAVDGGGLPVIMVDTTVGQDMELTIASIPAGEQVIITLQTRLANNAAAIAGVSFTNTAAYTYAGIPVAALTGGTSGPLLIVEPAMTIAKVVNPNTPPNAGDVLSYSLTFTASGGAVGDNFSDAYDLRIDDSLSLGLAYVPGTATVDGAGNTIIDPVVTGDGLSVAQSLLWRLEDATADIDIVEGTVVTVTYDVIVLDNVLAGQNLSNSASNQWTSIDGVDANQRDGSDAPTSPSLNDYFNAPVTTTLTTLDNTTLSKTRLSDTFNPADANVRIGDLVDYELHLHLDEGSHKTLTINDVLPQGLQFEQVVSINGDTTAPYSSVAPFVHNDIATPLVAGNAALAATTVTWTIGDVVNVGDNNAANDEFVIIYRARLLNNDVFNQVNSTGLSNTATLNYVIATGAASQLDTEDITLLQPDLAVTKSVAPAGGDTIIDAGELITYTVDVINSGAAPAYDTVVQDILPVGLRQGGITSTTISLLSGATLPTLAPAYDPVTGIAIWNLGNSGADTFTIPAIDTLRFVYTVLADADLGPNQTMINAVTATDYYSFDNEAVPSNGNVTDRQHYGPGNTATTTLTTPLPAALLKATTQATAAIGEQFTYRITVPATPQTTALNDVRILDDLNASLADMTFVSVAISSAQTWVAPWTPANTGTATSLVIEDTIVGIDIPAGLQAIIDITVVLDDTSPPNVRGLLFNNTADYTYNVTQDPGQPGTSGAMTIVEPDIMQLSKTGPGTMRIGLPGSFTVSVQNKGNGIAWDMTITDEIPNPAPGGMCDAAPNNIVAQIYLPDGTTPVDGTPLVEGVDYITSFSGAPADPICTLTLTMQTADAAIAADHWLMVNYQASLDLDSVGGTVLTNVAAATEWFSGDTAGAGATGAIRTYTGTLSDGTVGTDDEQDAHNTTVEIPTIIFEKHVVNLTSPQNPGVDASPGDVLQYTLSLQNIGLVAIPNFSIFDELDALNSTPLFVAGSLIITSALPPGATNNTSATGGANGTGLVDIRDLTLTGVGGGNDTLDITFEITLRPVIDSATVVSNQAVLDTYGIIIAVSDDINDAAIDDPTETLITSAPAFQVEKTSSDITGDTTVLEQGDTLRYTITVKNTGQENSINTLLADQIPSNTSYVAGSTTLNGAAVADPSAGVSALQAGLLINATENTTAGFMRADTDATANNVATITFDVTVNASVIDGAVISNQGFVSGDGAGSGVFPQQPSDDPGTAPVDDPTLDVVGSSPSIEVIKTVVLQNDVNGNGIINPNDTLRYTITASNIGSLQATGVVLTDTLPADTAYVANSTFLNGIALADAGVNISPIFAGADISSSDLTLPLPSAGNGVLSPGNSAVLTFDVTVNALTPVGRIISNQAFVSNNEIPTEPSDADGIDANGDQPTDIVVGNVQQLSITKQVLVVGGGGAEAGGELEYVVRVSNIGGIDATNVVITDNLDSPQPGQMSYIAGSGLLNGLPTGVNFASPVVTTNVGNLPIAGVVELRFRVTLSATLNIGETVKNKADVRWDTGVPPFTDSASVDIDIGGSPGSANLNGQLWHDANFDNVVDSNESLLQGWTVALYRNSVLLANTLSDVNGAYQFSGVVANITPGLPVGDPYEIRFVAPGAVVTTATLGQASSVFTNGPQRIIDILATSGSSVQNMDLPRQPNGIVYDSVLRAPVVGVQLRMINQTRSNLSVPASCFDDPVHANQVTAAGGYYKFDLNFSDPAICAQGDEYVIQVQPPANGFVGTTSVIIPPVVPVTGAALDVPNCPGSATDQVPATLQHCENSASVLQPDASIAPRDPGTEYNLKFLFDGAAFTDQIYNNHIPVDPELDAALAISKVAGKLNVTRSDLVPYTITINNTLPVPLYDLNVIDNFPAGFKYVAGSARLDGVELEPLASGLQLIWSNLDVPVNGKRELKLLLIVGAGVGEGEYVNTAQVINSQNNEPFSGIASATVQVIPDPTFDCTDIIGKVFDDKNTNAYQDDGEVGLPGVQVATVRGLRVTTDKHGRFHITCAIVANEVRGSNFIMKVDDRTLPSGYRITTENPRVQRATRGKMLKFNFGASIHRVIRLDLAGGVFEKGSTDLRPQWKSRIDMLITELQKDASILRLTYLAENESESEVENRLDAIEDLISDRWQELNCCYKLMIETEVFWRKGSSGAGREFVE